jgi:hypothetical protein
MSNNKGIPTVGVRGIQFRSRIEAHWAYIFEKMGWIWDYEPIDLYGYIPDFIIKFGDDEILIEIKGDTNIWRKDIYEPHKEKIIRSGWKGHYAILGSAYEKQDEYIDGLVNIGKYGIGDDEGILLMAKQDNTSTTKLYSFYLIRMLIDKNCYHTLGDGCWDDIIDAYEDFSKVWVEAKNRVQWKGKQNVNVQDIQHNQHIRNAYAEQTNSHSNKCFICKKCGKGYNTKPNYQIHEEKCNFLNVLTCPKCMVQFANRHNKIRHIKADKCKSRSIINSGVPYVFPENGKTINPILIKNYGQERLDILEHETYMKIFLASYDIASIMVKEIHFNRKFPENCNIYYYDEKHAIIKSDDAYIHISLEILLEDLIKDKIRLVQKYASENKELICSSIGSELYDEIMELCHKLILLQTPANQYKRQRNKIMDMIRNNNCMII